MQSTYGSPKKAASVFYSLANKQRAKPMAFGGEVSGPPWQRPIDPRTGLPTQGPPDPRETPQMQADGPPPQQVQPELPQGPPPSQPARTMMALNSGAPPEPTPEPQRANAPPAAILPPSPQATSEGPGVDAQRSGPPPSATPNNDLYNKKLQDAAALYGKKTPLWREILGGALSLSPRLRNAGIAESVTHPGRSDAMAQLVPLKAGADEERLTQKAHEDTALHGENIAATKEWRLANAAARLAALKPALTPVDRYKQAKDIPGVTDEQVMEFALNGKVKPLSEKPDSYGSSPQGIFNKVTGDIAHPAETRPPKPQYNGRERMALQAIGLDPDADNLPPDKVAKALQSLRPITNNTFTPPAALDKAPPGSVTIDQVPDAVRGRVQQILDYRGDLPASSRNNPTNQAILYWANKIDPTLDASTFPVRKKLEAAYSGGGQQGQAITALNTAILHLGTLDKAVSTLDNAAFQRYNTFANWLNAERGNPQAKPFVAARTAFSEELARALKGGVATEGEVSQWNKILDESDSPAKARTTIRTVLDLVEKRALAQQDYYTQNMGRPPRKPFVSDRAQAVIDGLKGGASQQMPQSGSVPQIGGMFNGQRITNVKKIQ